MWFIDFGRWDLGTLLERNETRQELDLYIEQLYYGFRKSVAPDGNSAAAGGWGMIVNMDDWTLGKALDFTGKVLPTFNHYCYTVGVTVR